MRPYLEAGLSRTTRLDWIDNYGKNWWCSFEKIHATEPPGEFPNKQQKAEAHKELVALLPFDNGSNYLSKIAIEWANGHPEDPRVPEALYRTVRSTRYGCAMDKSRNFSREAFQILHRKYPKSEWTKKTPYWY